MKKIAPALIALAALAGCTRNRDILTKEEVIQVINRFDAGWNNKNLKQVDSVLAPGYVYFTQSGGTFSRDSVVETAGSPAYSLLDAGRTSFDIQLYGSTAVVSTRWRGIGMYRGIAFNEDQRCSITVVKKDGKVQILSEHCTPIKSSAVFH